MLFPTFEYAIFLSLCFFIVWSIGDNNNLRKIFLIGASWVFYAYWDARFVILLFLNGLVNWHIGDQITNSQNEKSKKNWLKLGIIFNLSILGFFKYFEFFTSQALDILNKFGFARDFDVIKIILPVAISFFTFQSISYIIDIYRGKCTQTKSPLDLIMLTSFFPHLVAGPIVRATDILPQFEKTPNPPREFFAWGALLIIWGLFKKTTIASYLATEYVDPIFFDISIQSSLNLLLGIYAYAVQIYCDFSAYSDIAIGSAALLGYRFTRNFDQPYRASSLQDFWRRWHISLSSWLRDYLYISLGGNKGSKLQTNRNLMLTMVLGGLWHGANWTFVIWGFIHGFVLIIERFFRDNFPRISNKIPKIMGVFFTFHIVCFAWIFFRSPDFESALIYIINLFGHGGILTITPYIAILILTGFAINFISPNAIELFAKKCAALNPAYFAITAAFLFIIIDAMRGHGVEPFIYFQF